MTRPVKTYRGIPGPIETVNDLTRAALHDGWNALEIVTMTVLVMLAGVVIICVAILGAVAALVAGVIWVLVWWYRHAKAKRAMMVTTEPTQEES